MQKYLYGASVQGIQGFIFQTNKLTEIVGASEIVEQICTSKFREVANIKENDPNIILNAAGNIKYVFTDRAACENFVRVFPKIVMEMAPGITISQAVVAFENEVSKEATQTLEKRLRVQRNRAIQITSTNLMVSEVARKTGGAGVKFEKDGVIDLPQLRKRQIANPANKSLLNKIVSSEGGLINKFPFEMDDIATKDSKSWIAVVHADGNNLGNKIIDMITKLDAQTTQEAIKRFSNILNDSTIQAAKDAFERAIGLKTSTKFPFRPVVLGGDDLTAIVRGDLAIEFTKIFLEQFEVHTRKNFQGFSARYGLDEVLFGNGLTACAGISFIKASYPFHYGVKLSESLCKEAKRISKRINKNHTPSSLVFHKVHASFVEEYEDIIEKELSAKGDVRFNYGPYFIHNQAGFLTINQLLHQVKSINQKDAPKAGLRTWLTELREDEAKADQLLQRIRSLNSNSKYNKIFSLNQPYTSRANIFIREKDEKIDNNKYTPIFDIISLSNIQKTTKNG